MRSKFVLPETRTALYEAPGSAQQRKRVAILLNVLVGGPYELKDMDNAEEFLEVAIALARATGQAYIVCEAPATYLFAHDPGSYLELNEKKSLFQLDHYWSLSQVCEYLKSQMGLVRLPGLSELTWRLVTKENIFGTLHLRRKKRRG